MPGRRVGLKGLAQWGLPAPFDDELCISVVARHLQNWRYLDVKGMAAQLGLGTQLADPAAPGPVKHLAPVAFPDVAPAQAATRFMRRHTLLPYFLAYTSPGTAKAQLRRLAEEGQRNLRSLRLETVGYMRPRTLRTCVDCLRDDNSSLGRSYWHRTHQLPGLSKCPVHSTQLRDTGLPAFGVRWFDLRAASLTSEEAAGLPLVPPVFEPSLEQAVARESVLAIKGGVPGGRFISTKVRRHFLAVLGYGDESQIAATRLLSEFGRWVATNTAASERLGPEGWEKGLFTDLGRPSSPLQQILLTQFIQVQLATHDVFAKWVPKF